MSVTPTHTQAKDDKINASSKEVREIAALFKNGEDLNETVEQLEMHFPRRSISVMSLDVSRDHDLRNNPAALQQMMTDPDTPRRSPIKREERIIGGGFAVGVLAYFAIVILAFFMTTQSFDLEMSLLNVVLVGLLAGVTGFALVHYIDKLFKARINKQIQQGGLILWFNLDNKAWKDKALKIIHDNNPRHIEMITA